MKNKKQKKFQRMQKKRLLIPKVDSEHFLAAADAGLSKMTYFKETEGIAEFKWFKSGVMEYLRENKVPQSQQIGMTICIRYDAIMKLICSRSPKLADYVEYHDEEGLVSFTVKGNLMAAAASAPLLKGQIKTSFDNQLFEIADSIDEKNKDTI